MQEQGEQTVRYGGAQEVERPLGRSIKRGLLSTCPACGTGRLFRAFLKPVDTCAVCGEEIHHHRADDLPAYLVIVVVGHVLMTGYLLTDMTFRASPWVQLAIWVPLAILTALVTIQPIKGGVIGFQWSLKMHGFGGTDDKAVDPGRGGPIA
ncbi:Zinc-finger protein [Neorhizobium galegae bv. officinalis bv. officinalis str. HAMBI 1141]|uniref:Zinc-finger protein n=1 Tax=Neorhizobium galegae bv. officinalis bv. officinalis str. HAMBI 1141 TaxID=1028801 RepID=A0A068T4X4_NEOGA|nr:DUF983 domain-containing protein [Neorhizobium galegae]CDN53567.1 Zinc-finger protein [Neorhizobium galegae bv. officinalis bv. officinalis str. HAMBI 1141]